MSGGPATSFAWFTISSRRRLMRLTVRLKGATQAERKALWDDFFKALDIDAWKGRPVKSGTDYPPFVVKKTKPAGD